MIIGHSHIVSFLDATARQNAISHAYLFVGPSGVGKRHVAFEFGKWLEGEHKESFSDFAKNNCICDSCAAINNNSHADFRVFEPPLRMEDARELKRVAVQTPFSAPFRIYIINKAETLAHEAGQALLKELEEPRSSAIFFLIARSRNAILPTLASRGAVVRFRFVPIKDTLLSFQKNHAPEELKPYWHGRPGHCIRLIQDRVAQKEIDMARREAHSFVSGTLHERFALAEKIAKNERLAIGDTLEIWAMFLARERAFVAIRYLQNAREAILTNGNAQLALEYVGLCLSNETI